MDRISGRRLRVRAAETDAKEGLIRREISSSRVLIRFWIGVFGDLVLFVDCSEACGAGEGAVAGWCGGIEHKSAARHKGRGAGDGEISIH